MVVVTSVVLVAADREGIVRDLIEVVKMGLNDSKIWATSN